MSLASHRSPGSNSIPWGVSLAAVSILLIGIGTIIWVNRDESDSESSQAIPASGNPEVAFVQR